MDELAKTLITLGGLFVLGLATDLLGRRTPLPRVTLLLLFGLGIGSAGFDLLPDLSRRWFPAVTDIALVMVGFLLGGKLTLSSLRGYGRQVLGISIVVVAATAAVVFGGLILIGAPLAVALLLAGIATATDPAASADVVHEAGAEGPFAHTLLGIVALDDAWGLIAFSFLLAAAQAASGLGGAAEVVVYGLREVGGAALLGIALGVPVAYLTGRVHEGEPTLVEALGAVFLCGGIALWLEVSYLLAAMVMGAVVANLARHHSRPFHAIEGIEWPFLILFFVLAGAALRVESLPRIGAVGAAYIALRILGRLLGAWVGSRLSRAAPPTRRWMGIALMPQAGVALGMAIVGAQRFPELADTLLPVVIGATVVFEIVGPVLTRYALVRVGEAHPPDREPR